MDHVTRKVVDALAHVVVTRDPRASTLPFAPCTHASCFFSWTWSCVDVMHTLSLSLVSLRWCLFRLLLVCGAGERAGERAPRTSARSVVYFSPQRKNVLHYFQRPHSSAQHGTSSKIHVATTSSKGATFVSPTSKFPNETIVAVQSVAQKATNEKGRPLVQRSRRCRIALSSISCRRRR